MEPALVLALVVAEHDDLQCEAATETYIALVLMQPAVFAPNKCTELCSLGKRGLLSVQAGCLPLDLV